MKKKTNSRLHEREFQALFDNLPALAAYVRFDEIYLFANRQYEKLRGWACRDIVGKSMADVLGPLVYEKVKPFVLKALSGVAVSFEVELPFADGGLRWLFVEYKPEIDDKGFVKGFIALATEITRLKLSEQSLKSSEKKYRQLFELAQEGIWVIDVESVTTMVNPSMARMLGYCEEEMVGKVLFDFMDAQAREQATENIMRRNGELGEYARFEFIRKDGVRVYTTMHSAPMYDEHGRYAGAIAGIIDVTQRKKAEEERTQLENHLIQVQKMEAIGTLAGGIAHDFNNILSVVVGFSELACEDARQGSVQLENLGEVLSAARRARDLVSQILIFARQGDVEVRPVRFSTILKEAVRFLRSTLPSSIEITTRIISDANVMADPTQLHQIIMNLGTNAAHAMGDKGHLTLCLEEKTLGEREVRHAPEAKPGRFLRLRVSDTGCGIVSSLVASIFNPYFTTKDKGEGTGLGLSVVKGIVDQMKGMIEVVTVLGEGSSFDVFVPLLAWEAQDKDLTGKRVIGGHERVLYVDDEPAITLIGKGLLENVGYRVEVSQSAIEALERVRENPEAFDVIITDLTMPRMRGDALAREIQALRSDLPVILCTGQDFPVPQEHLQKMGISALLKKPIGRQELAQSLREVLDRGKGT
ncbi:PAS domain-containing sensor histidine kinase [Desulfoluna sp.]|uniref:hybrid sensor histidine kinase/response regulator n=1 Tax=Desulfoluna sp. TaxID=2045199 RepID=UPI00262A893F|nr:PAS domain-containing sensor histidine kinase [Desulfoluna sp.]